jgi:hypothetical protein
LALVFVFSTCIKVVAPKPFSRTTLFIDKGVSQEKLWETLQTVIEIDFGFSFKLADMKKGNFTTEFKPLDAANQLRSQLFITIRPSSDGNHVTVFQFLQRRDEARKSWNSLPSDQSLESRFVARLEQKLQMSKNRP